LQSKGERREAGSRKIPVREFICDQISPSPPSIRRFTSPATGRHSNAAATTNGLYAQAKACGYKTGALRRPLHFGLSENESAEGAAGEKNDKGMKFPLKNNQKQKRGGGN